MAGMTGNLLPATTAGVVLFLAFTGYLTDVINMQESPLIPLAMLNAYVYCPRRFYYEFIAGVMQSNEDVEKGRIAHKHIDEAETKPAQKEKDAFKTRSVYLSSESYGVTGKIDLVEEQDSKIYPVEYKKRKTPLDNQGLPFVWDNDRIQLCAQGLLLESNGFSNIEQGYLYYAASKQRVPVKFDEITRQKTLDAVKSAQALMQSNSIPPPFKDDNRCTHCSINALCLPDETSALSDGAITEVKSLRPIIPLRHDEGVLYVQSQGATIQKKMDTILVRAKDGQLLSEIPLIHLRQVVVYGNVQISTQTLSALFTADVPVIYLSTHGRFKGVGISIPSKNSALRMAQYEFSRKPEQTLKLANSFIQAKIHNQRVILMRYARAETQPELINQETPTAPENGETPFADAINRLKSLEHDAIRAQSPETLLGLEGNAAREYFGVFSYLIKDKTETGAFDFNGRNKRPPKDPVNALLSLAYSLLAKDCFSACLTVGFDPFIGFFHESKYGRPALALDVMEEFRPVVADSVVLTLINNKMLATGDFFITPNACYLNETGRKKFFEAYENRLNTDVTHPLFGYKIAYSRVIETQVRLLARLVTGEIPEYVGFKVK